MLMKYICACLNTNGGVVKLRNHHCAIARSSDLYAWYSRVEDSLFDESSTFIQLKGNCNDALLYLVIKPLNYLFSLNMHLFFSRHTNTIRVGYTQAIGILRSKEKIGSLYELPSVVGDFEYNKTLSNVSANDQIQFKNIVGRNVPQIFSKMIDKHLSAFCNNKGGRILFGIENKEFRVVGVELTNEDKRLISMKLYKYSHNNI